MTKFLQGVLATLITGITLFFVQHYYESKSRATSLAYYQYKPAFYVNEEKLKGWSSQFSDKKEVQALRESGFAVNVIVIENNGENLIQDQDVVIGSSSDEDRPIYGVIAYQNDVVPGGTNLNTTMKIDNGFLKIHYKALEPREIHRFWVVSYQFSDLRVIARGSNLHVDGWNAKIYTSSSDDIFDHTILLIIITIVGVIVGIVLDSLMTSRMLKKRGYDLVEIMSSPAKSKHDEDSDNG